NPWTLDARQELERETGGRVSTVLQLRLHPQLIALRERLHRESGAVHDVCLTYITARGAWYDVSWKGSEERSGGIVTNIGIHLFDLLLWLFGPLEHCAVHLYTARRAAGELQLASARVRWFLSTDASDLPTPSPRVAATYRSITVDGERIEFSEGFGHLHTQVYAEALAGRGFRIADARPSIALSSAIRRAPVTSAARPHSMLTQSR